jgi:hypothetical protein
MKIDSVPFNQATLVALLLLAPGCNTPSGKAEPSAAEAKATPERKMKQDDLNTFGLRYAGAWSSQKPDSVAAFFAENGTLTVNHGTPAVGRPAIAAVAKGFMDAFPDMVVTLDSLPQTPNGADFHWTLTGTNTGPGGTGRSVRISGVERWRLNGAGLIETSDGSFDADDYNRQLHPSGDKTR